MKEDNYEKVNDLVLLSYSKCFEEDTFIAKLRKLAFRAGSEIVYKALLLYYILLEESIPMNVKILIGSALGYLIFPTDLVPDFIIGLGFTDDLAALAFVLDQVERYKTNLIETKAKQTLNELFY